MMANSHSLARVALYLGFGVLIGCGPNYAFDPGPPPPWLRQAPDVSARAIVAVGSSAVTPNVALDLDLARRDGLHQIASTVRTRVSGHTSAWQGQITGEDGTRDEELVSQNVELRTRLPVEGAEVVGSYRDEATATMYVKVRVNTGKWAAKVSARLKPDLEIGEGEASRAEHLYKAGDVFGAMESAGKVRSMLNKVSGDAGALMVLRPGDGWGKRMAGLSDRIDRLLKTIREATPFSLHIQGGTGASQQVARSSLETFLAKQGFRVATGGGTIQVHLKLGAQALSPQRVGNRVEHRAAARGTLKVIDPRGREVSALTVNLVGDSLEERGANQGAVQGAALELSAHTLVSQFRSRLRQQWGAAR